MTGSSDAPGQLNELSSDIDTLSENLLETYTNLLHLERVLQCRQESADGAPAEAGPEQRWRRQRRSYQLAAADDGVSEQSGPPADCGHTEPATTGLERRVTELEADVRRIDQEKEEIRVKYTAVLKRLRRLQVSSSENWDVKSPTSTGGDGGGRSPEAPRWPPSVRRQSAGRSVSESGGSGVVSRPSTGGTLPPAVNGLHRTNGPEPPPGHGRRRRAGSSGHQGVPGTGGARRGSAGHGEMTAWRRRGSGLPGPASSPEEGGGADDLSAALRGVGGGSGSSSASSSDPPGSHCDRSGGAALPADPLSVNPHPAQQDTHESSPLPPSESHSDFPAGVNSCDGEDHFDNTSSVHPGTDSAHPSASHSSPTGGDRPVLPGSRSSSPANTDGPAPPVSHSLSHPGGNFARGDTSCDGVAAGLETGRPHEHVPASAPAGATSCLADTDRSGSPRQRASSARPEPGSATRPGSSSEGRRRLSGSSQRHQHRAGSVSPEENVAPPDGGGDDSAAYSGAGGAICGSFAAWPPDGGAGGSPPLLSPLLLFARPSSPPGGVKSLCEVTDSATQTETERSESETVAALEATIRRKNEVIASMQDSLAKVEAQLVTTRQQLQNIETDVLQRLASAERAWRRRRRQLQVDLAGERAVTQTLHAVEADLGEQLRRCRRRCAELEASLAERTERGHAAGRGGQTSRRRSRRLAALCHQLAEHVGRLLAAQTRLTGELMSTLQQLFGLFSGQAPAVAPPCHEATLATLPLWLPWLTAEARLACRARQQRQLPATPPEALPSPPPGGGPPHLAALVTQVWDDIERLRRLDLDLDEAGGLEELGEPGRPGQLEGDGLE